MIETVSLNPGSAAHTKPSANDLAAALSFESVAGAADILAAAWIELENYASRVWGARPAEHVFRLLEGVEAEAFPLRPVAESVTLAVWRNGAWTAIRPEFAPDGVLRNLTAGELYRVQCANLGDLGSIPPPKPVTAAVLRLAAWRASHAGGMFLPLASGPTLAGYAATDGVRRSGASELLAPFMHYDGNGR